MKYDTYSYIYPPRPESKINPMHLSNYDNGEFVAQPKLNGDCSVLFLGEDAALKNIADTRGIGVKCAKHGEPIVRNRHNELKDRRKLVGIDFASLQFGDGYFVYAGEILDKAKKDEHGEVIKGFGVWDILVYDGNYLIGSTLEERLDLLENLLPARRMVVTPSGIRQYEHLLITDFEGVYRVPTYMNNFAELYSDLIKTDLYEGILLKKKNAKLELGFNEKNNSNWQLKARKPTRIYKF